MTSKAFNKAALFMLIAIFCAAAAVPGLCAGKKQTASSTSKVPASILSGSDVTSGRVFKKIKTKENTLAGVKLGDSALKILQKYGNPTKVIIHSAAAQQQQTGGMMGTGATGMASTMPGSPSMPSATGMTAPMSPSMPSTTGMTAPMSPSMPSTTGMTAPMSPSMPSSPSMSGTGSSPSMPSMPSMGGSPSMPSMPGMSGSMPSMPGMGGAAAASQSAAPAAAFAGTSSRIDEESLCWQYDLPAGTSLEFIVTNSKISQITVVSLYPWKYAKLNNGIMIGDTYKLVTYLMGIDPGNMQILGNYLRMDYMDKYGVALTFLNKKLVGMTIAVGDPIYNN